jgi:hypothetical protein
VGTPVLLGTDILSQMADNTPAALSGISCGTAGVDTAANSWWRRFYLSEHGGPASIDIESVTVASETGPSIPATINLYSIPHGTPADTIPTASLTLIGSGTGSVGGDLTTSTIPVTATLADAVGTDLVVEYHIDGSPTAPFFPGGNASAETHPSFISAADCGLTEPVTMASIGFPDAHNIIVVNLGDGGPPPPTGCAAPSDLPWASVDQAAGTTAPAASTDVTVTFDSTGLAVGSYDGLLCVASNDPVTPLVEVPVSLTVTGGGGGGELLMVDLSIPNQITVTATSGVSLATASGSTTSGWLFENFFANAGTQGIDAPTIVGTATLTAASVPPDGSPSLFRGSSTDAGLNIWSYSGTGTTTFTAGQVAFTGSATWSVSPAFYAALVTAPASGDIYFPADTSDDIGAAQLLGTYSVTTGGGGNDPAA